MVYSEGKMVAPLDFNGGPQINAAVAAVQQELSPWVRHIRYDIALDWSGQWGLFFRVLLSDDASSPINLREIAPRVAWSLSQKLDPAALGLFPYFDFRSESEQARSNQPAWA